MRAVRTAANGRAVEEATSRDQVRAATFARSWNLSEADHVGEADANTARESQDMLPSTQLPSGEEGGRV